MITSDTICAIATAQGGALGIIRLSGPEAITAADKIFRSANNIPLSERPAGTLSFGCIIEQNGEIIDEVLASLFRAPHSYTGEDTVEFSCHGSSYILQQIIRQLITVGCRTAGPGEFTQRAFLNGKMDLSQAEAVADLIASTDAASHRMAMTQMRGGFSKELQSLRNRLLHLTSLMELELDFADHEELEFADRSELIQLSAEIHQVISRLVDSFEAGNAIKKGIPVAIIGETNAGKSTLLNALLHEDKAIVSDIHGTTRDVIEDTVVLNGITFRFIDTAGIRETTDTIEALGIERSFKALEQSQIAIVVYDMTRPISDFMEFIHLIRPQLQEKQVLIVPNKCDLHTESTLPDTLPDEWTIVPISAKTGLHLDQLRTELSNMASLPSIHSGDIIVSNLRHYEALQHALEAIERVSHGLQSNLPADLTSQDLRDCIFHLSDIIGEVTSDEVLHNIFKHFCIGK